GPASATTSPWGTPRGRSSTRRCTTARPTTRTTPSACASSGPPTTTWCASTSATASTWKSRPRANSTISRFGTARTRTRRSRTSCAGTGFRSPCSPRAGTCGSSSLRTPASSTRASRRSTPSCLRPVS
ncbi:unnamed protein product, partial [Ixodes pacificus]